MSKFVSHTRSLFFFKNTKNPQVNGIYSKIWQHLPKSIFIIQIDLTSHREWYNVDTLSTVGACPARLTATVVGSGSIETRPSILTGVVQTFVVFLKKKKEEKQFNILS